MNPSAPYDHQLSTAPRWRWSTVLFAGAFTLGFLLLLPGLESLAKINRTPQQIREVNLQKPPPSSPPALPPPASMTLPPPTQIAVLPTLDLPPTQLAIRPVFELAVPTNLGTTNWDVQFQVRPPAPSPDALFEIGDLDSAPQIIFRIPAAYPQKARLRKIEGFVQLSFVIDSEGATRDISVVASEPAGLFDSAAIRAVSKWRFKPGNHQGRAVNTRASQTIRFEGP
jgi:protein TonB